MSQTVANKYLCKQTASGTYTDINLLFDGVKVLKSDGFFSVGKSKNVYQAQWVNSQTEDFLIAHESDQSRKIIRENVTIELSFAISQKYTETEIDEEEVYAAMCDYFLNGEVYLRSQYAGKDVRVIALEGQEPNAIRLKRNNNNFILASWKFHALEKPYRSIG